MAVDPNLPEWTGPVELGCCYVSEHTHTVRYRWCDYPSLGGFYVPRSLLPSPVGDPIPRNITVLLAKSDLPARTIGYRPQPISPRFGKDFWEFDMSDASQRRVFRYDVEFAGRTYALHVPKEIFRGLDPPTRLIVQVCTGPGASQ